MIFRTSGDIGDSLHQMLVVRHYGGGMLVLNQHGLPTPKVSLERSGYSLQSAQWCRSFFASQPYITDVKIYDLEWLPAVQDEILDLDAFRYQGLDMARTNLCFSMCKTFNVPLTAIDTPWLTAESKQVAKTVFARSLRYRNPRVNWRHLWEQYHEDSVFIGLPEEHKVFEREVGKVDYYAVNDLKHMAEVIQGSNILIGNQSAPIVLAIGLGHAYIQEVCAICPNCMFARANASYVMFN